MAQRTSFPSVLEIHLLGPFRVLVDGQLVDDNGWQRAKPKLLVKLLALQPHRRLHREQVIEVLWPGHDVELAANNLHKAIHMARRALEPELRSGARSHFILTQGRQIVLSAPEKLWVDVEAFEQAAAEALRSSDTRAYERAMALYEGDLLVEDLYEDWAATRREQLRARYQQLLSSVVNLHETRGEYDRGIERLKELVACDSTNEEAHRELMRLYALTGNKHQALRQYQLCCEALRRGLDVEPDQSTRELHEQIVSGQLVRAPSQPRVETISSGAIDSLAVLPLANISDDPEAEYFSDGITETIINSLSQLPQLKVMARSTVFRYKGDDIDPQEVGSRLGVRAVLTGRVFCRSESLNIQTELVDARDGSQLWGEQYNRRSSDIFEVQEEIAKEITEKLRLKLSGDEKGRLAKRHTENPEAYQLYLMGIYFWNKRTVEAVNKSIEFFRRAIDIDPDYALAYAGLSNSYAKLGDVELTAISPREAFSKAKTAALRALELDDKLAEAHTSLAHVHMHDYDWPSARREFKRAIELNSNYATTRHWYAYYLTMTGRVGEAMKEIAKALELDPLSLPINTDLGELLYFTGQYDKAVEQFQKTLDMDAYYYQAHLVLARVYEQKEMFEEAIAEFFRAQEISADSTDALASLGHAYGVSGKKKEARDVLARLNELSKGKYVSPYNVALIHLGLGERDRAFEWLRRADEERASSVIFVTIDPRLDPLRSDREFTELLQRVGLHDPQT